MSLPDQAKLTDENQPALPQAQLLAAVIEAQEEYIELLGAEITSMTSIATIHGWRSNRSDAGLRARSKITSAKKAANNVLYKTPHTESDLKKGTP